MAKKYVRMSTMSYEEALMVSLNLQYEIDGKVPSNTVKPVVKKLLGFPDNVSPSYKTLNQLLSFELKHMAWLSNNVGLIQKMAILN